MTVALDYELDEFTETGALTRKGIERAKARSAYDRNTNRFAWKLSRQRKVVALQSMTDFEDALQTLQETEVAEFGLVLEDADLVATYVEATPLDADTRNFYPEPDVTTIKPSSVGIFWRMGTCTHDSCSKFAPQCVNAHVATIRNLGYRTEQPTWMGRRTDVITTPAGHRLYPAFNKFGDKLLCYWIHDDANITFQMRVGRQHRDFGGQYYYEVRMYHNTRRGTKRRMSGPMLDSRCFYFRDLFASSMETAEQRATYWIMAQLSKTL